MARCPTCHRIIRRPQRSRRPAWDSWLTRHDDLIRERVAAGEHPREIAALLSARFPIPRTELAVRRRIRLLGLSIRDGWYSREDAIRMLGVSKPTLVRLEEQEGVASVAYGRWHRYHRDDLERLVRVHAGVSIDPRRVRDPALKAAAETAAVANRRPRTA